MKGQRIGAGFGKRLKVPLRVLDHEMDIEWQIGELPQRANNRKPETNIGDKDPIHHIHMQCRDTRLLKASDFVA